MLQARGLLRDPLSEDHVLLCCVQSERLYRLSLADGLLTPVAGAVVGTGTLSEGPARDVQFKDPTGLAPAPRELYRDSDALVLLMCDSKAHRLCLIRVPFAS
jgi:hypothetical protein